MRQSLEGSASQPILKSKLIESPINLNITKQTKRTARLQVKKEKKEAREKER